MRLSRAKLEQLTNDLVERSRKPCLQALKGFRFFRLRYKRGGDGRRHDKDARHP